MDDYHFIVDRSRYNRQTIDLFEVVGAYYTELFFIHFYEEGKALKINNKVDSITEGYRHVIKHFLTEYEKHDVFKRFLNDLCEYYIECGFPHVMLTDFVHLVIQEILPAEYFKGLSKHQCSVIIFRLLRSVVREFALRILNEFIVFIIDHRDDKDKVRLLQDEFIDLLLLQKHEMQNKINNIEIKTNSNMQHQLLNKMKSTIKRMLEQMAIIEKENVRLKEIIVRLSQEKKNIVALVQHKSAPLPDQPTRHQQHEEPEEPEALEEIEYITTEPGQNGESSSGLNDLYGIF